MRIKQINSKTKKVYVHGYMKYKCEKCGKLWDMYLEEGIESFDEKHKPSPFVIRCRCGGFAKDVSGVMKFPEMILLADNQSYFANKKENDYGVPVLQSRYQEG